MRAGRDEFRMNPGQIQRERTSKWKRGAPSEYLGSPSNACRFRDLPVLPGEMHLPEDHVRGAGCVADEPVVEAYPDGDPDKGYGLGELPLGDVGCDGLRQVLGVLDAAPADSGGTAVRVALATSL